MPEKFGLAQGCVIYKVHPGNKSSKPTGYYEFIEAEETMDVLTLWERAFTPLATVPTSF